MVFHCTLDAENKGPGSEPTTVRVRFSQQFWPFFHLLRGKVGLFLQQGVSFSVFQRLSFSKPFIEIIKSQFFWVPLFWRIQNYHNCPATFLRVPFQIRCTDFPIKIQIEQSFSNIPPESTSIRRYWNRSAIYGDLWKQSSQTMFHTWPYFHWSHDTKLILYNFNQIRHWTIVKSMYGKIGMVTPLVWQFIKHSMFAFASENGTLFI